MPGQSNSQFLIANFVSSLSALTADDIDQAIASAHADPGMTRLLQAARMVIQERDSRVLTADNPHSDRVHVDNPHSDRPHSDRKLTVTAQ